MKIKSLDEIRAWVHVQIEQWAQDNCEAAESWSRGAQDMRNAGTEKDRFIKAKKEEFDNLLKGKL